MIAARQEMPGRQYGWRRNAIRFYTGPIRAPAGWTTSHPNWRETSSAREKHPGQASANGIEDAPFGASMKRHLWKRGASAGIAGKRLVNT